MEKDKLYDKLAEVKEDVSTDEIIEGYNANKRLLLEIEEGELPTTDEIRESIAILSDGTLISGDYDCGIRGLDHNILLGTEDDWDTLHASNIVRLVPESHTALIGENQRLNSKQQELLNNSGYEIAKY